MCSSTSEDHVVCVQLLAYSENCTFINNKLLERSVFEYHSSHSNIVILALEHLDITDLCCDWFNCKKNISFFPLYKLSYSRLLGYYLILFISNMLKTSQLVRRLLLFNLLIWIWTAWPASHASLNPIQISGQEEIVVHFLTNWVKRTLSGTLRKQMAPFITGGHWWRNGAWTDTIAANGLTGNIRAFVDRAGKDLPVTNTLSYPLSLSLFSSSCCLCLSSCVLSVPFAQGADVCTYTVSLATFVEQMPILVPGRTDMSGINSKHCPPAIGARHYWLPGKTTLTDVFISTCIRCAWFNSLLVQSAPFMLHQKGQGPADGDKKVWCMFGQRLFLKNYILKGTWYLKYIVCIYLYFTE